MKRRTMCRWMAAVAAGCLLPATGVAARQRKPQPVRAASPLLEVSTSGGFRPAGPQQNTLLVRANGQVQLNGKPAAPLAATELQTLSAAIRQADFRKIRSQKGSGTRPSAYDGLDILYTFHTSRGAEKVNNWDTKIDPKHPLFQITERLRQKYREG